MDDKGTIKKFESSLEADLSGFPYKLSDWEANHLSKLNPEDRVRELCVIRYEWVVLQNQGKRKISTMEKVRSRNAIRFAFEFLKMAKRND